MGCTNCQNNQGINYIYTPPPGCDCKPTTNSCTGTMDSSNVIYTGPKLLCSDVASGTDMDTLVQKLDAKICTMSGGTDDYSSFDFSCLTSISGVAITTEKEFVEGISEYVCTLEVTVTNIYNEFQTFVTQVTQILQQNIEEIGVDTCILSATDSLGLALTKLSNEICELQDSTDQSGVNWNVCGFTVATPPTTPDGTTNLLLSYICQLKTMIGTGGSVTLPTFDNRNSCLAPPNTATDTLFTTVEKLKTKVCELDYSLTGLTFGCVTPGTTINSILQNMLNRMNQFSIYQFNPSHFSVTNIDAGNACLGKMISINTGGLDKHVASDASDSTPGTLFDKLQAGSNVSLDYLTTPGKVIISSTATPDAFTVKAFAADGSPSTLDNKLEGQLDASSVMNINVVANTGTGKVNLVPTINWSQLVTQFVDTVNNDSGIKALFDTLVCSAACNKKVSFRIFNETVTAYQLIFQQNSPVITWLDTGNVSWTSSHTTNTGSYGITDPSVNPVITIQYTNFGLTPQRIRVIVTDLTGSVVSGSTSFPYTMVAAGATITIPGISLGTSTDQYVVRVDIIP